jgi:hypothetical protein
LHQVALTLAQVRELGLPSTPLKATEKRKGPWIQAMQHEQTEIDALAALRPEVLRDIALEAIEPFYDPTLAERTSVPKRQRERVASTVQTSPEQWRRLPD